MIHQNLRFEACIIVFAMLAVNLIAYSLMNDVTEGQFSFGELLLGRTRIVPHLGLLGVTVLLDSFRNSVGSQVY
jgi:hypothetical protein